MAKILQSGYGDTKCFTITGLSGNEFFTLFDIVENAYLKALNPDYPFYYDHQWTQKVIHANRMMQEALDNKIKL